MTSGSADDRLSRLFTFCQLLSEEVAEKQQEMMAIQEKLQRWGGCSLLRRLIIVILIILAAFLMMSGVLKLDYPYFLYLAMASSISSSPTLAPA